jgi:hypothetical protein
MATVGDAAMVHACADEEGDDDRPDRRPCPSDSGARMVERSGSRSRSRAVTPAPKKKRSSAS